MVKSAGCGLSVRNGSPRRRAGARSARDSWKRCRRAGSCWSRRDPGPNKSGGGGGLAAIYDVPHRRGADAPRVEMPPNIGRPEGKLRLYAEQMRIDAGLLSQTALRVFAYVLAHRDRTREGAVKSEGPCPLPLSKLAAALRLGEQTVADALKELVKKSGWSSTRRAAVGGQPCTSFRSDTRASARRSRARLKTDHQPPTTPMVSSWGPVAGI